MSNEDVYDSEVLDLSLVNKVMLKIPKLSLEGFSERFQGIFWVLVMPLLVTGNFFINLAFLTMIPFPFNCVAVFALDMVIVLLFLRILLERALNTRKAMLRQSSFRWNVEQTFSEYERLLGNAEKRKAKSADQASS